MARKFKTVNYAESLQQTVTLGDCLASDHLARFIVGMIGLLVTWGLNSATNFLTRLTRRDRVQAYLVLGV